MGLDHSRKKVWFKSKGIGKKQRTKKQQEEKQRRVYVNVEIVCKCAKPLMFKSIFLANSFQIHIILNFLLKEF